MTNPLSFQILRWTAWAPGISDLEGWLKWREALNSIRTPDSPPVKFVPPLLRRRASQLARISLETAYRTLSPERMKNTPVVFASRHGEAQTTELLLTGLAADEILSPMAFSLSVHNAASGVFSIAAGNREPVTALAAGRETFVAGLIETITQAISRSPDPVLLVTAEELVPEPFQLIVGEDTSVYGMALLISSGQGDDCSLRMGFGGAERESKELPQALEFLSWLLTPGTKLSLSGDRHCCEICKPAASYAPGFAAAGE